MKKSKVSQATLFQSWGHSAQSSSSRNPNSNRIDPSTSQDNNVAYNGFDPNDIVDIEDDDDDDELLAAAEGIAPFDDAKFRAKYSGHEPANNATEIKRNDVEIEVIPGFDLEAGNVWVYPTNYPIRNYQYDIVEQALYKNTLVTLPTGLGKTFIAAVIMYNFYRWYPQGKVIFMAPTKPLVAQQIEACYNIMGIPQSDTAEMTGSMAPNKRQAMWQSRRVFFLTPQVLQNDLNRGSCKAEEVVLLVADEAHKALGNHAYCQVVREISGYTRNFRVLALSATPGDNAEAVQQVITNLLIAHMELRSEESPDIKPYTHSRLVEKVVVSLGENITKVKNAYLKILETIVGRLFCQRVLWNNDPQRVTKYMLLTARDQYRKKMNERGGFDRVRQGLIEGDFAMCISLYHAYELLLQHGILSFYNFVKAIMDGTKGMARAKAEIAKNHEFTQLMDELREEIEPPMDNSANESLLFSQFSPKQRALMNVPKPSTTFKSHPKLLKLKEIVLEHFEKFQGKNSGEKKGVATRVMIFSQYRDSVNEIAAMLSQHKPVVRVMSFIGQQSTGKSTRGLSQKEQLQVVQRFRQGGYNTLVATCVGEEGLDIGEVDLIVCFDAHASPIRLVQRMGRTGRKRDGRIVILVTEGKEEQIYMKSQRSKKSIHKAVTQAAKSFDLYTDNHRMVPRQITPVVLKMEMTVGKFVGQSKGKKKERPSDGANIKNFTTKSAATASKKSNGFLTYEELVYWQEHFKLPDHEAGLSPQLSVTKKSRRSLSEAKKPAPEPSLTEWLPWQTTLNPVKAVTHSRRTEHLVELLEFTELHGGRGDDDESYDLEMMSFLNEEDILRPGQREGNEGEGLMAVNDDAVCEESEERAKITKKGKKSRKKLQMEDGAEEHNETSSRKKGKGEGATTTIKKGKGLKKRSPENKARWKELLKQFDKEDEDFESNGVHVITDVNNAVDDCAQRPDDETLRDDVPDVEEPWEPVDNPVEVDNNRPSLNDNSEAVTTQKEAVHIQETEGGDLSDAVSDELSDLFPAVTPYSQGAGPVCQLQQARFPFTMASVPTPPSLDTLDKISISSAGEDLDDFNTNIEEFQRKHFGKNLLEKATATHSERDTMTEPFLMADFLEEEELQNVLHTSEGPRVQQMNLEEKAVVTSTPETSSETAAKADIYEGDKTSYSTSEKPFSKNNVDRFESSIRGEQDPRDDAKTCNTRGVTEDRDSCSISMDIVADTGLSSTIDEKDANFGEGFFMDVTDDDVFTNMTLPEDDSGVNDTRSDQSKHAGGQDMLSESGQVRIKSRQARDSDVKHAGENSVTGARQFRSSVQVDLEKSINKLSAFQRPSTNDQDLHSGKKEIGVSAEMKRSLSKEDSTMDAKSTLPSHEIRTKGELSSSTALQSDVAMFDAGRNSVAAGPSLARKTAHSELSNKFGMKTNHQVGLFGEGVSGRDGGGERPGRESHLTESAVANGNTNAGDNVRDNTGGNIGDNIANNICDNACRSPLPKKLRLSRKRTSPKNKEMPAIKSQSSNLPLNDSKSLDFGSSRSLSLNQPREENFCGTNLKGPNANSSPRAMECKSSDAAQKHSLLMGTVPKRSSFDCKETLANPLNLRTENGNVVAVMESDDDDEDAIRPVGKASSRRRQALSSPCSQGFKIPADPGKETINQRRGSSSRFLQLGSESDEEFETDKSAAARNRTESVKDPQVKHRARKRNSLEISAKQGTRKSLDSLKKRGNKRLRGNHFLDEEAELSGSDINDFSSDETDDGNEDEMDSFIDDATQLTQRTPSATKPQQASSPVDMMAVYRQSLMSPLCGALNFQTPLFHKQRNKYKMVYKNRTVEEDDQSASEAEETYELESFLENEVEGEDENEAEAEYEREAGERAQTNAHTQADVSFEESQVGRPVKRLKRKRILDDTFDEEVSPKFNKQRNLSQTCDKENIIENKALGGPKCINAQMRTTQQRRSVAFGNFSTKPAEGGDTFHGDFVKSSQALTINKNFYDNASALRRSAVNSKESMRRSGAVLDEWNNDISDSELLVALEDKAEQAAIDTMSKNNLPLSDQFHDQDMNEIAVAMDMTDRDVSVEIETLPNFSIGFDFLWEVISEHRESARGENSSRDNSATYSERSKASTESLSGNNSAKFSNFTKITQHSKQSTERSYQHLSDQQKKNKASIGQVSSCPASKSTTIVPRKVTNSNISSGRSVISGQRLASNNSLTAQNKCSQHADGQRSTASVPVKLQVVAPSCRPNNLGTRPAISPLLTSSQKDKGKTVILVDTREIASSQVVSLLRLKHNIKAEVCQLISCDYIVSNRMAVKRKTASDVANGNNSQKLVDCMRRMCDLYDRPCLIIEKDRVKPGETEKHFIKTKAYIFTLSSIAQTHVKLVFSDSQEETARLLTDLATIETKKGTAITAPTALSKEREQVFRVLLSIPRVSCITALNLCSSFTTLHEIINSTPSELERRTRGVSSPRAIEIHKYLRHKFNSDMLGAKK